MKRQQFAIFLFAKRKREKMQNYTLNQILKTLEKLFESNYTTTKQIKNIKWDNLEQINKNFAPVEKSLVMDFRDAVNKKKVIEFLAGKNLGEESEKNKNDRTI